MSSTGLIAQKQRSKRVKHESRVVGRPKSEKALKRALCANLQMACEALAEAAFEVRNHPYLPGVRCRSDGMLWVPANGPRPGHWTFGCAMVSGYREVVIRKQHFYVHRLVAEAFHGVCPEGCEVDHINRDKSLNTPGNLRWVTRSQNQRNRDIRDKSIERYGVAQTDDKKAYDKAYRAYRYKNDPKYRAIMKAAAQRWRAKKKTKKE